MNSTANYHLYSGSYTEEQDEGIIRLSFDDRSGEVKLEEGGQGGLNPSFLALDSNRGTLYAVNEIWKHEGVLQGLATSYRIEPDGSLSRIGRVTTIGNIPCQIALAPHGDFAGVATYCGESAVFFKIGPDGALEEAFAELRHEGSGPDKERQAGPHPHSVNFDRAGRFAHVPDLGIDQVLGYRIGERAGKAHVIEKSGSFACQPGSGPRHMAFSPSGEWAYLVCELSSSLHALRYDAEEGKLEETSSAHATGRGDAGSNFPSEVLVSADGRQVYVSNRGKDVVSVFSTEPGSGELSFVQSVSVEGEGPRAMSLSPSGRFLLTGNTESNSISVFSRDSVSGKLKLERRLDGVKSPSCLRFFPAG